MYHSVTGPFSQSRIYNFNTDIDEYKEIENKKKKTKKPQILSVVVVASENQNVLKLKYTFLKS